MASFPSLDWFKTAQQKLNADPAYRKLGSADTRFAVKQGNAVVAIQLEAFECAGVQETTDDELREMDFCIDMSASQWRDYLDGLRGISPRQTLSTLDLSNKVVKGTPRGRMQAQRYLLSVEKFLEAGAKG